MPFLQNHKGAMMELGEGLNKLRKFGKREGPFYNFEQQATELLEFVFRTQMEHAACEGTACMFFTFAFNVL